jgi:pimeloyl-ACP methyl ester carboxylesterase
VTPTITPFRIDVSDGVLADLRERLRRARFPEQLPGAAWDYGTERGYLERLVAYWAEGYDWRAREQRMNSFEQFCTEIDGAGIHFLHVRSPVSDALPIVLTHGWPGSFVEFLDVIEPLADPAAHGGDAGDAFHVVVPSLPGYAFSGPTRDRGWHPGRVAGAWRTLMGALGYDRYVAQGGDWGSFVTLQLGLADPDHCAAVHVNMLPPIPATEDIQPDEQAGIDKMNAYNEHDSGYYKEQSTKPQTIGYALDDSPVGLAAWIVEKFRTWTDPDGELDDHFTKDQLLDNLMVYWVTTTAHSSARMYYEFAKGLSSGSLDLFSPLQVPLGYARYPNEIMYTSKRWAEAQFPLSHFADMPRGGHFAAFEVPELFVPDVRECFRSVR